MSAERREGEEGNENGSFAEDLYHDFTVRDLEDLRVSLPSGKVVDVIPICEPWEDAICTKDFEIPRENLSEKCRKWGVSTDFFYYFLVFSVDKSKGFNSISCSDSGSVGLVRELEGIYRWSLGDYEVMPPELKGAIERQLKLIDDDKGVVFRGESFLW